MEPARIRRYTIRELQQVKDTYRDLFLRGLLVVLPLAVSGAILLYVYGFVEVQIGQPMNQLAVQFLVETEVGRSLAVELLGVDEAFVEAGGQALVEAVKLRYPRWLGIALAASLVFVVGVFLTSFLGREVWPRLEARLARLPLLRSIYPYAKQIGHFLFEQRQIKGLRGVVAFCYPRPGAWSLGLVMSEGFEEVGLKTEQDSVAVLVPFGCGPYAWVAHIPASDVINVDMKVEEALRLFITNGLVVPAGSAAAPGAGPAKPSGQAP